MKAGWAGAARFSCKPTGKGSQNQAPGGTRLRTTCRSKGWEKTQTLSPCRAPSCKALAKEADPHGHGWCTEHPELSFILPLPAGFRHSTAFPGRATPWGCNDPSGLPFQPQKEDFVTAHSIRGAPHRSQPPPRTQFNIFHLLNPLKGLSHQLGKAQQPAREPRRDLGTIPSSQGCSSPLQGPRLTLHHGSGQGWSKDANGTWRCKTLNFAL